MNRAHVVVDRIRRSRPAVAVSAGVCALLLAWAAPSLLGALGTVSPPIGCQSSPDLSDDLTDDLTVEPVAEDSNPCVLVPDGPGGDDDAGGGAPLGGVDPEVVSATPNFAG